MFFFHRLGSCTLRLRLRIDEWKSSNFGFRDKSTARHLPQPWEAVSSCQLREPHVLSLTCQRLDHWSPFPQVAPVLEQCGICTYTSRHNQVAICIPMVTSAHSIRTMVLRFAIPLLLLASYVSAQTQTVVMCVLVNCLIRGSADGSSLLCYARHLTLPSYSQWRRVHRRSNHHRRRWASHNANTVSWIYGIYI